MSPIVHLFGVVTAEIYNSNGIIHRKAESDALYVDAPPALIESMNGWS